jgi:hypothetical protein
MNYLICSIDSEPGFASMYGATNAENAVKVIRKRSKGGVVTNLNTGKETDLTELKNPGDAHSVSCNDRRYAVIVVSPLLGSLMVADSEID